MNQVPAVVGELVQSLLAASEQINQHLKWRRESVPRQPSIHELSEWIRTIESALATLSALTAEAGKGEEYASRVLDRFVQIIIEEQPEGVEWTRDQRVHAMQRALSTATPAGEWFPIESAPKGDARFLVYLPNERNQIQTAWQNQHGVMAIGSAFSFDLSPATHWRPLPAPPLAASPRGASEIDQSPGPKGVSAMTNLEEIRQAVARGWCADTNAHKEMDVDLADAIANEVAAILFTQGESDTANRHD